MSDLQKDLANLQSQMSVFIHEVESSALHSEKKAAFDTICRLPSDIENPITWGFVGAYRYGDTGKNRAYHFGRRALMNISMQLLTRMWQILPKYSPTRLPSMF